MAAAAWRKSASLNLELLGKILALVTRRPASAPREPPVGAADSKHRGPYLAALQWNLDMYIRGECPDYRLGFIPATSAAAVRDLCHAATAAADRRRRGTSATPSTLNDDDDEDDDEEEHLVLSRLGGSSSMFWLGQTPVWGAPPRQIRV